MIGRLIEGQRKAFFGHFAIDHGQCGGGHSKPRRSSPQRIAGYFLLGLNRIQMRGYL
jgi:hypothetical protein